MGGSRSTATVSLALDPASDVLYAKLEGAHVSTSRSAPSDDYLILNEDVNRQIIGVQILHAADFAEHWVEHPEKHRLPAALRTALDEWSAEYRLRR